MTTHPEEALFIAGASDQYYEISGASYTPATEHQPAVATIDLSTADQTGCLLKHIYSTGETTLRWDTEFPGEILMGVADDVVTAINDITRETKTPVELFTGFQAAMLQAQV